MQNKGLVDVERVVSKGELVTMKLAKGGGQAIELEKVKDWAKFNYLFDLKNYEDNLVQNMSEKIISDIILFIQNLD